jgi:NADP-dependent aldehyde dehydrogenase
MGSTNPVFILPGALESRTDAIADGLFGSVTLGVGQFCTNPGVVAGLRSPALDRLAAGLRERFGKGAAGSMLYAGIRERYDTGVAHVQAMSGVASTASSVAAVAEATEVRPTFFEADVARFLAEESLQEELFGPASILVSCGTTEDLMRVARSLEGSLTATIHGTEDDLVAHRALVSLLETRVGRLIVNGYPTGVEVSPAMQHGGPYPATTDAPAA